MIQVNKDWNSINSRVEHIENRITKDYPKYHFTVLITTWTDSTFMVEGRIHSGNYIHYYKNFSYQKEDVIIVSEKFHPLRGDLIEKDVEF